MKARLITLLVAVAAIAAIAAAPARSVTAPGSGSPGNVDFTPTVSAQHVFPSLPRFVLGATRVHRSPADGGTQLVTVTYAVFSNTSGTWATSRWNTRHVQLAPGYHGNFSAVNFSGLVSYVGYKAMIVIEWKNARGALLGTRVINYDGNADYNCYATDVWTCSVYNMGDGWGAFVGFGMR